jgi:hypothetical protein
MIPLHIAKNLEISYDPENRFMYCNWIGFQNEESIINSGAVIIALFAKMGVSKVLNDNTLVTGPWYHAAEWTSKEWFPAMIKLGLKHFAWVFSPDAYATFSSEKAMPQSSVVKAFTSYDEALQWLLDQP